jgi:hypothetical protein
MMGSAVSESGWPGCEDKQDEMQQPKDSILTILIFLTILILTTRQQFQRQKISNPQK